METLERIIAEHPFFAGLDAAFTQTDGGLRLQRAFQGGRLYFREGDPANTFYLIRGGRVAVGSRCPAAQADHRFHAGRGRNPGLVVAAGALQVEAPRPRHRRHRAP